MPDRASVDWFFDRYSFAHAAFGAVAELSNVSAPLAIALHTAFEGIENEIKPHFEHIWPDVRPDAWQNQVGDTVSFVAGYYGSRLIKNDRVGAWAIAVLAGVAGGIWAYNLTPYRNR